MLAAIDAFRGGELDGLELFGGRGCGVLTSVGCVFFGWLQGVDHVFLLLAAAGAFLLEDLAVYIEVFLFNEERLLAILDVGIWSSGSVAVGRMEESGKLALWAADLLCCL
jgi:hypothetical protein